MLDLLKLEWKKYRKNRLWWFASGAYLIALPALLFIGKSLELGENPIIPSNDIFFEFPTLWKFLGYIGNWLTFFILGFLGIYFVAHDFAGNTLRPNIITGMTRSAFFRSKLQLILVVCLLATLYFLLSGYVIGMIHSEPGSYTTVFEFRHTAIKYFLMCLSYMVFAFFIAIFIRKFGLSLILFFSYVFVIEPMLRYLVHLKIYEHKSMHFYPMNATEDLMPVPFSEMTNEFIEDYKFSLFLAGQEAMITTSIYIAIFLVLSWWWFKKADL